MRRMICALVLVALAGMSVLPAAEDFPSGKISFIIGNAPGGGNDLQARSIIPGMSRYLGNAEIIPENLIGANGGVAAIKVGNSKPDGHTLFLHSQSLVMMRYTGQPQVRIDKLAPVALVAEDIFCICVAADSPYQTLDDFIKAAKENPGKLRVGAASAGIAPISIALFEEAAGIKIKRIPYDGGGALTGPATVAGELDACVDGPLLYRSLVEGGKLRPLVVFGEQRSPVFPDVKTLKESGINSSFTSWRAVFAPAGTPEPIMRKLSDAVKSATGTEEFKNFMQASGSISVFRGYDELTTLLQDEDEKYGEILAKLGMRITEPSH